MRFRLITPAIATLIIGIGLAYYGTQQVEAQQKRFIGSRKINNLLEKVARIEKIVTIAGITEFERSERIQESLELGFDATAAFKVRYDDAFHPLPIVVTQHSDFNSLHKGPLTSSEFQRRPEFARAIEIYLDIEDKYIVGAESGHYYTVNGVEYHFVHSNLGLRGNKNQIWLITNVDEAAREINEASTQWLIINGGWQAASLLLLLGVVVIPLTAIRRSLESGVFPELPFFAPIEIKDTYKALQSFRDGQGTAEAELKKQIIEAKESADLANAMMDNIPGSRIFVKDSYGIYKKVNQGFIDDLDGLDPTGRKDLDLWAPAVAKKYVDEDALAMKQGLLGPFYELQDMPSGDSWGQIVKAKINVNGEPCVLGVRLDVTELFEQRERAERLREQAEQQANEIELMNHVAAHDVMASIKGSRKSLQFVQRSLVQMVDKDPENNRLSKQVAKVNRAITALGTANELLEERSKMLDLENRLEKEKYLVIELVNDIAASINRPGFKLSVNVADDLFLMTDRSYVKRIFTNLVENGFNHNNSAAPSVKLLVTKGDDDEVVFVVKDNGIGLSQESIEKIGKLPGKAGQFNQDSKGSGLGWFTVRRVLEAMKYRFKIESKLGQGTTITVIASESHG